MVTLGACPGGEIWRYELIQINLERDEGLYNENAVGWVYLNVKSEKRETVKLKIIVSVHFSVWMRVQSRKVVGELNINKIKLRG